jgi:hypothetical protein
MWKHPEGGIRLVCPFFAAAALHRGGGRGYTIGACADKNPLFGN